MKKMELSIRASCSARYTPMLNGAIDTERIEKVRQGLPGGLFVLDFLISDRPDTALLRRGGVSGVTTLARE